MNSHFLAPFKWVSIMVLLSQALAGFAITFTQNTYITSGDTTYDGAEIVISNCTVTVDGFHSFASIRVADGGVLTHSQPFSAMNLNIAGDVIIEPGGAINANSKGFAGGIGPGAGLSAGNPASGSGAGHGGYGGLGSSNSIGGVAYGGLLEPVQQGSGGGAGTGGAGGPGGGAIKLIVGGTLHIHGSISANGANGLNTRSGGGSGGSIWLAAQTVTGAGSITANGGAGEPIHGGGGGGGRIAIYYSTNTHTGIIAAHGGNGFVTGGSGTIYLKAANQFVGQLVVDNGGRAGAATGFGSASTFSTDLLVTGGSSLTWPPGTFVVTLRDLIVGTNSSLLVTNPASPVTITVTSNAIIQAGGAIIADGGGFPSGQGIGAGKNALNLATSGGSGAGHAGYGGMGFGGILGGNAYGTLTSPADRGSGGGNGSVFGNAGGAGGGALRLNITGALQLDGSISANGNSASSTNSGGGSGGSIRITAGAFSGSGKVAANGGNGTAPGGGGGGGGRIAITYNTNSFAGSISAFGGDGFAAGGAGTVYLKANNQSVAELRVDNGGRIGTNTFLGTASSLSADLSVSGGSSLIWPSAKTTLRNLIVGTNSSLLVTNPALPVTITVTSNAIIQAGGAIIADGGGFPSGQGGGAGKNALNLATSGGSGAGHAGYGGMGFGGIPGGNAYGSLTTPIDPGSGGGNGSGFGNAGGAGGGALRLEITGALQLDGSISANGNSASSTNSGGGSGGSIWITAGAFSGSGKVAANGGNGIAPGGGGGGGGRIAITYYTDYYNTNNFAGTISAHGGDGFAAGGAGTVYLKANNPAGPGLAELRVDNGGRIGTNTTFGNHSTFSADLSIAGGASLNWPLSSAVSLRNLMVATNSALVIFNLDSMTISISGNVLVEAGGKITALGTGSGPGSGTGAGSSPPNLQTGGGSGAGHGGFGAAGVSNLLGGTTYGSLNQPGTRGSGGGNGILPANVGGAGGGVIRMQIGSLRTRLHVDGLITADGANASGTNSGGGSGGSIWISARTISGTGVISANGGHGSARGGGGGGGRIAIESYTDLFSGTISAYGGDGFAVGGAGTIYRNLLGFQGITAHVVVDNGGRLGTNTTLGTGSGIYELAVSGGGVITLPNFAPSMRHLLVKSNGWVNTPVSTISITGNATVEAGGGIIADGKSDPGVGTGRGYSGGLAGSIKGGGGYGGFGGNNPPGWGGTYGNIHAPSSLGSRGGDGSGYYSASPFGGAGGGVVRLNVGGSLTLHGRISANGLPGSLNSGGGSGGSVWLTAKTLAGSGVIAANGGAGGSSGGGGGGGGRIAVQYANNLFTGAISARGGPGGIAGGAGTIYLKPDSYAFGQVLVDNGGQFGTNTPITNFGTFDLTVQGGAVAHPASTYLVLSNLFIGAGGQVISGTGHTNLELVVRRNLSVSFGGAIATDGKGFAQMTGPGAGTNVNGLGSGGGHGGRGGASANGAPGGRTYGWVVGPTERGSGGGFGSGPIYDGSHGGGAIRLHVGGTFTLDGWLNANGAHGVQDNSGGGAGGSIWVTSHALAGSGWITAQGGQGELYGGGGGGGGRIALYYRTNYFHTNSFTGFMSALGGNGATWGNAGSMLISSGEEPLLVATHTPNGVIRGVVSSVDVQFNAAVDSATLSAADILLRHPSGTTQSVSSVTLLTPTLVRAQFPTQSALGVYTLRVGPQIEDYYGQQMPQAYEGAFIIALPIVTGTVTDAAGLPVSGVVLQPDGALSAATTDANGFYQLEFPVDVGFTVTPSLGNFQFVPSARTYLGSLVSHANQNYVMVTTVAPEMSCRLVEGNWLMNWHGIAGVTYEVQYSTNLVNWQHWGFLTGTNGPIQLLDPVFGEPMKFFRVHASY